MEWKDTYEMEGMKYGKPLLPAFVVRVYSSSAMQITNIDFSSIHQNMDFPPAGAD